MAGKVFNLKRQRECDRPIRCPMLQIEGDGFPWCAADENARDPSLGHMGKMPRPEWCPLPVTVFG